MEQSSNESPITDEDMEVAKIMLELPHLILQSLSRHRFAFTSWLCKKKRSSRAKVVAAAAAARPPSPPSSLPSKAETVGFKEKPLTSSPATPLAFSPSESDEKHKPQPSKRKSYVNNLKKKKEQLVDIMEDFTRRNELLKKDIETKKRFCDQQMAENVGLKAKKQKLLETSKSFNLEIELPHIAKETENSTACYHHRHEQRVVNHEPLMNNDQTVHKPETNKNCEYPINGMICWVPGGISNLQQQHDNVGPVGLFDLNVSAEEAFFDMDMDMDMHTVTKARAAEARFKRKQICRSKNFNAAYKARYPF